MTFIKIDKKDRRWLAGWLRGNLICFLVAASMLFALRVESTIPVVRVTQASIDRPGTKQISSKQISSKQTGANQTGAKQSSGMEDPVRIDRGISVAPQGWRRTSNGWELASRWRLPSSLTLGELILIQRDREPVWIRSSLKWLRELPPLTFAMFQLTAIAAILCGAALRKKTQPNIFGRVSIE